jgi:hypothetical protein
MAETTKYLDDTRSLEVLEAITNGLNFEVPDVDFNDASLQIPASLIEALNQAPSVVSRDSVTNIDEEKYTSSNKHTIEGTGSFDVFMSAYMKHLEREFAEKRIQGADYANVYTQLISKAMDQAIQFELSKEQSRWQGIAGQLAAYTALWGVYKAKVELAIAKAQALTNKAQYAAAVAQLGNLDATYGNALAQHDNIIAQTAKTREDINLVVKNEALVAQQTVSFKRRDEYNAVKLQADAFTIQKSIDEGTVAPSIFQSSSINDKVSRHISNVGL